MLIFKIVETPTSVVYLAVNLQPVEKITLSVVDQGDETIDFCGEVITRRYLKPISE